MNEETDQYIKFCINFCHILQKHNITPILVFDGQSLPAKAVTKAKRTQRKNEVRKKINEMLRSGDNKSARWLMRQCVDVTFEMVYRVVQKCREEKIDYIVAPFEADAQMAYLVNHGIADYAITEDSDLLVFGCKKVLCKLDRETEKGSMISLEKLNKCFNNFTERKFQYMCILSGNYTVKSFDSLIFYIIFIILGCDYLENIPSVGMGRARKFFENYTSSLSLEDMKKQLMNLPSAIKMEGKVNVTKDYIKGFVRAVQTFDHQLVFSPFTGNLTPLKNLKGGLLEHEQLKLGEFAGNFFDQTDDNFIIHYVTGNIHTKTMEKMDADFVPHLLESSGDGKFSWFTEELRKRVEAKRSLNLMSSSLFVPESPLKMMQVLNINEQTDTVSPRESKRKMSSIGNLETSKSTLSTKRIKSVLKCSENEIIEEHEIASQEERNGFVSSTKSLKAFSQKEVVERNGIPSRTSSRNIFRKSETELKKSTNGVSVYFQKKTTSVKLECEVTRSVKVSPKKASSTLSDDSDLEIPDYNQEEDFNVKAKLNASVSSIEDEDKAALSTLNSQSSGYSSQKTRRSQSTSVSSSPAFNDSFTTLKSQPSTSKRNTVKKASARTSTRSTGRSSKSNNGSSDIRKFFKTTPANSDSWIDID